jgi:hypothetical protein
MGCRQLDRFLSLARLSHYPATAVLLERQSDEETDVGNVVGYQHPKGAICLSHTKQCGTLVRVKQGGFNCD